MKNKKIILSISLILILIISLIIFFKSKKSSNQKPQAISHKPNEVLAVNTIPVEKRPYVTLTPDSTGHNLFLFLDRPQTQSPLEYELVYNAANKEEGAFGRLDPDQVPLTKKILLGSKSAGGAVTYHEGITGGYLTLTYDQIKLKEDFNFFHFDPQNEAGYSSVDARFTAYFQPKQLAKNSVILIMKSFGLPKALPAGKLVAGPYYVGTAKKLAPQKISLKVSASKPLLYQYQDGKWSKLEATYQDNLLTATPNSNLFIVIE